MTGNEIRQKFLDFFKNRGHTVVASDLLVPTADPTLLFTGAGMNQFKEQFMGKNITYSRAATCQKCIRTGDLENVGRTPRHHTFFEMLGNFSFGDYFKKEAIAWGWEFMTVVMGIPEEKLWVSVYTDDDESYDIWLKDIKIPAAKIVRLGAHDNFWPADAPTKGPNGPCGPCSEIFYDWGESVGCGKDACDPSCDCGRFIEVWNLVFTEFERKPDGALVPLPNKNIDTGMGLERVTAVMQGAGSNFKTDLFASIIDSIKEELKGRNEDIDEKDLYRIADHIRAATFAIADGVSPANEKRGYVVRKLIRRAFLKGKTKGTPFLFNIVPTVAKAFGGVYPELEEKREHIASIVNEEEKRFSDTLGSAMPVLMDMLDNDPGRLSGEQVFKLVDTYGMPIDIINSVSEEKAFKIDLEGFEKLMADRKEQSRKGSDIASEFIFKPDSFTDAPRPEYSEEMPLSATIGFMVMGDDEVEEVSQGDNVELVTAPQSAVLYAEAGGQVGDAGVITASGSKMKVIKTLQADGRKILQAHVTEGSFRKGDSIELDLDSGRKSDTAKNHTATHLLQASLRSVLGEQVKQSGSYVDHKRLRFDFTHMKKLTERELVKVEDMVNAWVAKGIGVNKKVKTIEEAKAEGALSFFGEKYGDTVRVVSVGEESKEFCGGTHVDNTSEIGLFKIVNETSVASGIRRIEAVTGEGARTWIRESVEGLLKSVDPEDLDKGVREYADNIMNGSIEIDAKVVHDLDEKIRPALVRSREEKEKAAKKREKDKAVGAFSGAKGKLDAIAAAPENIGDVNFVSGILEGFEMPLLRKAVGYMEKRLDSGVLLLGGSKDGGAYLICAVTPDLVGKGLKASDIVAAAAPDISGSGGGKPEFAQAGGTNAEGLKKAIENAKELIKNKK